MREARRNDVDRLVALAVAHGQDRAFMRRAFETDLSHDDRLLLLASADGKMVGYGRCARFEPGPDAPPDVAPAGYYRLGCWSLRSCGGVASQKC